MTLIEDPHFQELLERTKIYCARQIATRQGESVTELFRSLNPVVGKEQIFKFAPFTSEWHDKKDCMLTHWATKSFDTGLVNKLFIYQRQQKRHIIPGSESLPHQGAILVSHFFETVVDGASAVQSDGFVDDYDLPPIDTWFYSVGGFMFSWVPEQFSQHAQNAIDVNCVDCIGWFHPEGKMVYGKHPI